MYLATVVQILGNLILTQVLTYGLVGIAIMDIVADFILVAMIVWFLRKKNTTENYGFAICEGPRVKFASVATFIADNAYLIVFDSLSSLTGLILIPLALSLGPAQQTTLAIYNDILGISVISSNALGLALVRHFF